MYYYFRRTSNVSRPTSAGSSRPDSRLSQMSSLTSSPLVSPTDIQSPRSVYDSFRAITTPEEPTGVEQEYETEEDIILPPAKKKQN